MKIGAHPRVVAVALGLLGPTVLEVRDDEEAPETVADWSEIDPPSLDEQEAVAQAWALLER